MATHSPEDSVNQRDGGAVVDVSVSPNSPTTEVPSGFNEWRGCWEARLQEPARDGRANLELLDAFEELFDTEARIESGKTARKKSVWVGLSPEEVLRILKRGIEE